jgi:hypothetical protein
MSAAASALVPPLVQADCILPTHLLEEAYVARDELQPAVFAEARRYVSFTHTASGVSYRLGIVDVERADPRVARAISSLLTRSLEDAKYTNPGGYLPPSVVERVQRDIISPRGVVERWGKAGHRFVLSTQNRC